jgi:hypothetical protein
VEYLPEGNVKASIGAEHVFVKSTPNGQEVSTFSATMFFNFNSMSLFQLPNLRLCLPGRVLPTRGDAAQRAAASSSAMLAIGTATIEDVKYEFIFTPGARPTVSSAAGPLLNLWNLKAPPAKSEMMPSTCLGQDIPSMWF